MGIGDWGLGIGDWGLGPIPNPQSPSIFLYICFFSFFKFILFQNISLFLNKISES
jgi:hypothetical protein